MPTPNSGESEQAFVSRCIPIVLKDGTAKDQKQAAAICYSIFRRESMHSDFQRIFGLFLQRYGLEEGAEKFDTFILQNKLDTTKSYNPKIQFQESFEWIEPLITAYKSDNEARFYLIRALTANISMNNVDYSDYSQMERAAPTLSWRPVNINHDHNRWLPYPRTRVDFSHASDLSVEATLRVDNRDKWLQAMLDNGKIIQPSIEGRPHPNGGYHFTGLALLEKGVELPGDPLTEIIPLAFNESVRESLTTERNGWNMIIELQKENALLKTQMKSLRECNKKMYEKIKEALKPSDLKSDEYYVFRDKNGKINFTKNYGLTEESKHNLKPDEYYCFQDSAGNLRFTRDWRIYKEATER